MEALRLRSCLAKDLALEVLLAFRVEQVGTLRVDPEVERLVHLDGRIAAHPRDEILFPIGKVENGLVAHGFGEVNGELGIS